MRLTEQQTLSLTQKLNSRKLPVCISCQGNDWTVTTNVFELREFEGGNLVIGGASLILPVIPLTCNTCGLILFFNAINLGLIENKKEDEKK
jgi:hypothetical protein